MSAIHLASSEMSPGRDATGAWLGPGPDPGMQATLADLALELDTFERFGDSYGYGFLVMQKRGDASG